MSGWRAGGLLLLLLMSIGCGRDQVPPRRPVDEHRIVVLEPVLQDAEARAWAELLRSKWPRAEFAALGSWQSVLENALQQGHLVVAPDSARLPVESWDWLDAFLTAGGHMLFLGADPFGDPVIRYTAEMISWSSYLQRLAATAKHIEGFSAIQLWSHEQSSGASRSRVRAAHGLPWQGVEVETVGLYEWDRMTLPEPVDGLADIDVGAITFFVRGSETTSRLVLRARQRNGVEWLSVVPATEEWQQVTLFDDDWHRVDRPSEDNLQTTQIDYSQIHDFSVGLDIRWAPQSLGPHKYGMSDIRFVPQSALIALPLPSPVPFIRDPARRAVADVGDVRSTRTAGRWRVRGATTGLVWQNASGQTSTSASRWISLFEGGDRGESASGSVGGIYLAQGERDRREHWGWVGLDLQRRTRTAIRGMLNEAAFVFQRGHVLLQATTSQHWYEPGESFDLTVQAVAIQPDAVNVRISAELVDGAGQIIRRVVSSPLDGRESELTLSLGIVPRVEEGVDDYWIEFGLEEIGGASRRFDRVRRPVKVNGVRPAPQTEERVRTIAGRLVSGRIPLFLIGADYDPGLSRVPNADWLNQDVFPAAQIDADFAQLRAAGVNAITIPYADPQQARQVRYVLDAARRESLWVNLQLPHAWMWSRQSGGIAPYLDAIGFMDDRNVISLDITPPERFGASDTMSSDWQESLHRAWTDWLEGQAGGWELARQRWGEDLRFGDSDAGFPTAADLASVPDDADVWPFLHRFVADWWSRELGRAAQQIRYAGYAALLTARWDARQADLRQIQVNQIPFLVDAGSVHLDFLTVVPGRLVAEDQDLGGEAFKAVYARGVMHGKPIVWGPLQAPVGSRPRVIDYRLQESMVSTFYRLAMQTQTSGGWLGQYRPIARQPWDVDEGIIDALGRRRLATRALRLTVNQLRGYRMRPLQWAGRELQPSAGPSAWAELQADWSHVYAEEAAGRRVAEIRPNSFGVSSMDAVPVRLANLSAAPFLHLHAEWGSMRIDGQEATHVLSDGVIWMAPQQVLRAEWINRGPARWSTSRHQQEGTVWLAVQRQGHSTQYLDVRAAAPGERILIEWSPVAPGTYTLRGIWWERGEFGPPLTIHVEESMLDGERVNSNYG